MVDTRCVVHNVACGEITLYSHLIQFCVEVTYKYNTGYTPTP